MTNAQVGLLCATLWCINDGESDVDNSMILAERLERWLDVVDENNAYLLAEKKKEAADDSA